jgi:hypothetical protein
MADFRQELQDHLATFRAAPFLVVGAGVSRRYLGLDDWNGLLLRLAALTGRPYDYYSASANGDLPTIASFIAEALHDPWWREKRFAGTRSKYEGMLHTRESALKAEASQYLAQSLNALPTEGPLAAELDLLRNVIVDGVITTNFDPLLETLFPDFRVFVGQEELLFEDPQGIGEIYKIHGSHEKPDSLVLTRRDYDQFHENNPYLAAKLMTIFVEHPIIFVGYSLSDENVASILQAIVSCLKTKERIAKLADRLIFVDWSEGVTEPTKAQTVIPIEGNQVPVLTVTVPDFVDVFTALGQLKRAFPAKLLRQLKEHVYELVLERDPKDRLHVQALDPGQDPREVDVVFGIGAIERLTAYAGLTRDDLITDVLDGGNRYDPIRVVQEALPAILTHPGNVPIYKYLSAANLLDDDGSLSDPSRVDPKVRKHAESRAKRVGVPTSQKTWVAKIVRTNPTLDKLRSALKDHEVLYAIPGLADGTVSADDLQAFLTQHAPDTSHESQWRKMVCLYDWLRYGRAPKERAGRRRPTVVRRRQSKRARASK